MADKIRNRVAKKMTREQKRKMEEDMKHPANRYLNFRNDDGSLKYPLAAVIRDYYINNPDPVLDNLRRCNAMVHEIRHHKEEGERCLQEYNGKDVVQRFNSNGQRLTRQELYTLAIYHKQRVHDTVSALRGFITNTVIQQVDDDIFTFDQYDAYANSMRDVVSGLGHDLFPKKVEIPVPT